MNRSTLIWEEIFQHLFSYLVSKYFCFLFLYSLHFVDSPYIKPQPAVL